MKAQRMVLLLTEENKDDSGINAGSLHNDETFFPPECLSNMLATAAWPGVIHSWRSHIAVFFFLTILMSTAKLASRESTNFCGQLD